jgi:hypothetical protein
MIFWVIGNDIIETRRTVNQMSAICNVKKFSWLLAKNAKLGDDAFLGSKRRRN